MRRLELAIQAFKTGWISSMQKAAWLYDIPFSILQRWLNGIKQQSLTNHTKHKLTETEKNTLLQWILSINKQGASSRPTSIQDMTNILLVNYDVSKPSLTVRINWIYNFIQHYDTLKTCFS